MSKKIKTLLVALVMLCSSSAFAKDFDWSKCWCNYGAGIEKGDVLLSVDAGLPWDFFTPFNLGGWAIPPVAVDLQVACPIWKLPFSFGGYVAGGYSQYRNYNYVYNNIPIKTGASVSYHVRMPAEPLDLYAGMKVGLAIDFGNAYPSNFYVYPDYGFNIGASWYFGDAFGVNLELGYPMCKAGFVFHF